MFDSCKHSMGNIDYGLYDQVSGLVHCNQPGMSSDSNSTKSLGIISDASGCEWSTS